MGLYCCDDIIMCHMQYTGYWGRCQSYKYVNEEVNEDAFQKKHILFYIYINVDVYYYSIIAPAIDIMPM